MQPLWVLGGSALLLLRGARSVTALVHYEESPVGAYDEWAIIELSWRGPSVTEMLVTNEASREAGRALWGFPKELADLSWSKKAQRIVFRKQGEVFRFRKVGVAFPVCAKAWTNQVLDGRDVRVPCTLQSRARLVFRGQQVALLLEDFEMQIFAPVP